MSFPFDGHSVRGFSEDVRSLIFSGWQRQAPLGDGGLAVRKTIAKAFGLDAATRQITETCHWASHTLSYNSAIGFSL
jgi:hypothetical protein